MKFAAVALTAVPVLVTAQYRKPDQPCTTFSTENECIINYACQWESGICLQQDRSYCWGAKGDSCPPGCVVFGTMSGNAGLCVPPGEEENKEKLCPLLGEDKDGVLQCEKAGCVKAMGPKVNKYGAFTVQGEERCVADKVQSVTDPLKVVLRFRLKGLGKFVMDKASRAQAQLDCIKDLRDANLVSSLVTLDLRMAPDGDEAKVTLIASADTAEYLVSIENKFRSLRDTLTFPALGRLAGTTANLLGGDDSRSVGREFTLEALERLRKMRDATGAGIDGFRKVVVSAAERLDDLTQCSDILSPLTTECGLPTMEGGLPTLEAAVSEWNCGLEDSTCCETLQTILEDNGDELDESCSSQTVETLRMASKLICSRWNGMSICKAMEQIRPHLEAASSGASPPSCGVLRKVCSVAPAVRDHFEDVLQELESRGIRTGVSEAMEDKLSRIEAMCSTGPSDSNPTDEDVCACAPTSGVWTTLGNVFTGAKPLKDLFGLVQTSTCDQKIVQAMTKTVDGVRDLALQCSKSAGIACDVQFQAASALSITGEPDFAELLSPKESGMECWPSMLAYERKCPQSCQTAMQKLSTLGCCAAQVKKDWLNAGVGTGLEVAVGVAKKCGVDIPSECPVDNPDTGVFEPFSMLLEVKADVINGLGADLLRRAVQKDIAEELGVCESAIPLEPIVVQPVDENTAVVQGQVFDPSSVITQREAHALGKGKMWGIKGRLSKKAGKGMRLRSLKKAVGTCGRSVQVIPNRPNKVPKRHRAWIVLRRNKKKKVTLTGCDLALQGLRIAAGSATLRVKFMNALSSLSPLMNALVDHLLDKFCQTVDTDAIVDRLTDAFAKCGPEHVAEISAIQSAFSFCETETGTAPPTASPSITPPNPPTASPFDPSTVIFSRRPVTLHTGGKWKLRIFMHKTRKAVWGAIKTVNLKSTLDDLCDTSKRWIMKSARKAIRRSKALLDAAGLSISGCSTKAIVEEVIDKIGCQKHKGVYLLVDEHVRKILKNLRKLKTLDVATICANPKLRVFRRFLRQAGGILGRHRYFPRRMRFYLRTLCQSKTPPTPAPAPIAAPSIAPSAALPPPTPEPFDPTFLLDRKADTLAASDCFSLSSKAAEELSDECHPMNLGLEEVGDCVWNGNCALDKGMLESCKDELKQYAETLGCCIMSELGEGLRGLRGGVRTQMKRKVEEALTLSGREDLLKCPTELPLSANYLKVKISLTMAAAKMEYQEVAAALHDDMLEAYGVAANAVRNIRVLKDGVLWGQGLERHAEALQGGEKVTYEAELVCDGGEDCEGMKETVREEGCEGQNIAALLADNGGMYSDDDVECPVAEHIKPTTTVPDTQEDSDNSSMSPIAIAFLSSFILGGGLLGFVVYKNRVNAARHAEPVLDEDMHAAMQATSRDEAAPYSESREEKGSEGSSPKRGASDMETLGV